MKRTNIELVESNYVFTVYNRRWHKFPEEKIDCINVWLKKGKEAEYQSKLNFVKNVSENATIEEVLDGIKLLRAAHNENN